MPILKRPEQEAFAQYVAQGDTQTSAARKAGYSENRSSSAAYTLLKKVHIRERIEELRIRAGEIAAASTGVTKAWVIQTLVDNVKDAKIAKNYMAVKGSAELIGKELGMFVDRSQLTVQWNKLADPSSLSDEELASVIDALGKLALGGDSAKLEQMRKQARLEMGSVIDVTPEPAAEPESAPSPAEEDFFS